LNVERDNVERDFERTVIWSNGPEIPGLVPGMTKVQAYTK